MLSRKLNHLQVRDFVYIMGNYQTIIPICTLLEILKLQMPQFFLDRSVLTYLMAALFTILIIGLCICLNFKDQL